MEDPSMDRVFSESALQKIAIGVYSLCSRKKGHKMLKLIGLVTVVYFAWSWGVISAVAYVAASVLSLLV